MIDQTRIPATERHDLELARDETSMRVFEYLMALVALGAALLLALQ